jgi:Tol biopolymer transport system component
MARFLAAAFVLVVAVAAAPASGGFVPVQERILVGDDDRLVLVDPATGQRTDLDVQARAYDWAPDGLAIAFAAAFGRTRPPGRLWVVNADGSGRRLLVPGIPHVGPPEWSPDGSMVAFTHARSPTASSLYVVRADGSGLRRLVHGPLPTHPRWSPNGKRLLYLNGKLTRRGLYVADIRTGVIKRLVDRVHYYSASGWSPDGSMISYVKQRRLYVARSNGTRRRRLSGLVVWGNPVWAPDGTRIAFESRRGPAYRSDIWTVRPNGAGLRRLTHSGDTYAEDIHPEWSPDGTKIAFISSRNRPAHRFHDDLFVMNADGSCETLLAGSQFLGPPRWRPRSDSGPPLRCTTPG